MSDKSIELEGGGRVVVGKGVVGSVASVAVQVHEGAMKASGHLSAEQAREAAAALSGLADELEKEHPANG